MKNEPMKLSLSTIILGLMVLVSILLTRPPNSQSASFFPQQEGRVRGTVLDFNEAVIPGIGVIFESGQTKQKVVSDEAGNFDIGLPGGVYQVTTEAHNFLPFRRAAFRLQPGTVMAINVVPVPRAVSYGTDAPRFYYRSFLPPYEFGEALHLLIRFSKQQKLKGIIEYSEAMASYDALTIYADKLWFDPKTFRLKAEGKILVEDGKQRVRAKGAAVEFKAGKPILKVTQ
jgi:hypothetical protein